MNALHPAEALEEDAGALVARLAAVLTSALGITKAQLSPEWNMGLEPAIEAEAQAICMQTRDFKRACRAFAAKEKSVFGARDVVRGASRPPTSPARRAFCPPRDPPRIFLEQGASIADLTFPSWPLPQPRHRDIAAGLQEWCAARLPEGHGDSARSGAGRQRFGCGRLAATFRPRAG